MDTARIILQVVIALGIFNVWLLRFNKATNYRGGSATSMEEEFKAYGFSRFFMLCIGATKVTLAVLLLVGLWDVRCAYVAGATMAALMLAAVFMHVKIRDPLMKAVPAFAMLIMSSLVFLSVS
jgi:uncharacterized membrane protein YkgB